MEFRELPASDSDYIEKRIQQTILKWACKHPEHQCVRDARSKYLDRVGNRGDIPRNLMEVTYCTAIREGQEREWDIAYKYYLNSNLLSEKSVLLTALGCTTKPWLLSRYLEFILRNDSGIRKQDAAQVFEAVASNPIGYRIAFNFMRSNWSDLKRRYGEGFKIISRMIAALPTYMKTSYEIDELQDFKDKHLDTLGSAEQALDRTIEMVKANIAWMVHSYNAVDKWLTDFNNHFAT